MLDAEGLAAAALSREAEQLDCEEASTRLVCCRSVAVLDVADFVEALQVGAASALL